MAFIGSRDGAGLFDSDRDGQPLVTLVCFG
jgi:hypothetical protein